jgi:hypothetical protein
MVQNISKSSPIMQSPPDSTTSTEYAHGRKQEISEIVARARGSSSGSVMDGVQLDEIGHKKLLVSSVGTGSVAKAHPLGAMYDDVIVHCMERTQRYIMTSFPYLVSKGKGAVPRFVSQLSFEPFQLDVKAPFFLTNFFGAGENLEMIPLPVEHGADFMCAGFQFGKKDVVVYISDVSKIPEETLEHLRQIPRIRLLVLDALRPLNYEKTIRPMVHFDLEDALDSVKSLHRAPIQTLFTGLGHEFDYETTNALLATLPSDIFGKVECAVDGMCLELDL